SGGCAGMGLARRLGVRGSPMVIGSSTSSHVRTRRWRALSAGVLVVALLPVTGPVGPVAAVAAGSASTVRVSVGSDGTQGDGGSRDPPVSADGPVVAFQSAATGLVAGDTNGAKDAFVHDRGTGTTVRVSVASDGTQGEGLSEDPALSADGRYVAFRSLAKNLVAGDSNHKADIFV